jgi:hypothetical protein
MTAIHKQAESYIESCNATFTNANAYGYLYGVFLYLNQSARSPNNSRNRKGNALWIFARSHEPIHH